MMKATRPAPAWRGGLHPNPALPPPRLVVMDRSSRSTERKTRAIKNGDVRRLSLSLSFFCGSIVITSKGEGFFLKKRPFLLVVAARTVRRDDNAIKGGRALLTNRHTGNSFIVIIMSHKKTTSARWKRETGRLLFPVMFVREDGEATSVGVAA
jgi:hypothetical protein